LRESRSRALRLPFAAGLPKTLDVGESFSIYFPYTGKTFLAEDLRKIGFTDTFNKRHWASRKELKHVLAKYKKELGPMAKTNTELERADDAVPVPEINSAK
jgi:hypothetical protein